MSSRTRWILIALFLTIAASFSVFWLPFLLPPAPLQAVSAANSAGFNNRVAVVAAGTLSLLSLFLFGRAEVTRWVADRDLLPMGQGWIVGWAIAAGACNAVLVWMVYQAHIRYGSDFGYFISPMTKLALDHRRLYTEVDFPYGPLLIYPPVWLRSLFSGFDRPIAAAYSVVYVVEQSVGLLLFAYVVQALPIRRFLRWFIFLAGVCGALSPSVGMNGTLRFAGPLAIFIFCARERGLAATAPLLVAGQMVSLGISPEMGFSFACGSVTYALFRIVRDGRVWSIIIFAPIVGAVLFLAIIGTGYINMLALFSGGGYNLIVEPQPYVLVYLIALLWLAPLAMTHAWQEHRPEAGWMYGIYGMGLGLLPVAFGRADYPHVFGNGLPILLLALVTVDRWRPAARSVWIFAFGSIILLNQISQTLGYRDQMRRLPAMQSLRLLLFKLRSSVNDVGATRQALPFLAKEEGADLSEQEMNSLQEMVADKNIYTPAGVPLAMEENLRKRHLFQPGMYFEMRDVLNLQAERKLIQEMDYAEWALVPRSGPILMSESPESTQAFLGIYLPYRHKRKPYVSGLLLKADLKNNWHVTGQFADFLLYRRNW